MAVINDVLLEEKLVALESRRQWSPRVISKLENMIRTADDFSLFRINPFQFSANQKVEEAEAIDLFLYASKIGLVEMRWNMVCTSCASVFRSFAHLAGVHAQFVCNVCKNINTVTLDDLIHVTFTISPQIRDIRFNHPENLSAEDYYFKYHLVDGALQPPQLIPYGDLLRQVTRVVEYVEASEVRAYTLNLEPGILLIRNVDSAATGFFLIQPPQANGGPQYTKFVFGDESLTTTNPDFHPQRLDIAGLSFLPDLIGEFHPGTLELEIENSSTKREALLIITLPPMDPLPLAFAPFLSGKQLLTIQTFRDLFRSEAVDINEGIAIRDITLMFTDLTSSTDLYDRIGDAQAFFLVRQHFDTLRKTIVENNGTIVKTIGDAVMAVFMEPSHAVEAALQALEDISAFNETITEEIILKIGIHRGHCIAVSSNDQADYFGQTVNIASRIQGLAHAGEICLSDAVFESDDVAETIGHHRVTADDVHVRGVGKKLRVHKIATLG